MAKTSSYLPPEIIEAILLKSSAKPLLRFKSVSKSWYYLISDPLFVKNHHHKSKPSNSKVLFVRFSGGFTLVKLEEQKLETVEELESPHHCNDVICRCEGVLLLIDRTSRRDSWSSDKRHVLWNPSARTQREFWIPCGGASYGLCHDPASDDFKVVIVTRDIYSVYSCKYKSFIITRKKFNDLCTGYSHSHHNKAVSLDGAIYWVWLRKNVTKIVYYDPRDDEFKILKKPENVKQSKMIYLADFGGFLCLRCEGRDKTRVKIWIKEKGIDNNSWKDLITIENVEMYIWLFEPQCFVGNKIVIRNTYDDKLSVYSPFEKTFEQFGDTELKCYHPGLIPYLGSSFFPVKTRRKIKRKRL